MTTGAGGERFDFELGELPQAPSTHEIFLPEAEVQSAEEWHISYGSESHMLIVNRGPVRRWELYVVLHSHTDLGFTAPASEVANIHVDNTDQVLNFIELTAGWPEFSRFKWTVEVTWQVEHLLKQRDPAYMRRFFELCRAGTIEICGLYSGELMELMGNEEAVQTFELANRLRHRYGITIDTAILGDVPGCGKGMIQILSQSGINNFIMSINNFTAPVLCRTDLPRPFSWHGDNDSSVLTWYTDHPFYAYWEGHHYGFADSYRKLRERLPDKLVELDETGYPYPLYQIQYAFDNFRVDFRPSLIVKEWNERWAYPQIRLATAGEFLNRMREEHGNHIPKRRGDFNTWWTRISSHYPIETSLSRKLHNQLPAHQMTAAVLSMLCKINELGARSFVEDYQNLLAWDEHTAGGMVWFSEDDAEIHQSVKEGYGYVYDTQNHLSTLADEFGDVFSKHLVLEDGKEYVTVVNPYAQHVRTIVEAQYSGKANVRSAIRVDDAWASQAENIGGSVVLDSGLIPPLSWVTYELSSDDIAGNPAGSVQISTDSALLQNDAFEVTVNPRGEITSVLYRKTTRECVDTERYKMQQVEVYETHHDPPPEMGKFIPEVYNGKSMDGHYREWPAKTGTRLVDESSAVRGPAIGAYHEICGTTWLSTHISLSPTAPRLEFRTKIHRKNIQNLGLDRSLFQAEGMVYVFFPLLIKEPEIRIQTTAAVLDPTTELFKGACHDHFTMRDWLMLWNEELSIVFSSPDVPIVEIGDVSLNKYHEQLNQPVSTIISRIWGAHNWGSQRESPFSIDDDIEVRFALDWLDHEAGISESQRIEAANRIGSEVRGSLPTFCYEAKGKAADIEPCRTFIHLSTQNVELMSFQKSSKKDWTIRLRENCGQPSELLLNIPGFTVKAATLISLNGDECAKVDVQDSGELRLALQAFEICTVRLDISKNGATS